MAAVGATGMMPRLLTAAAPQKSDTACPGLETQVVPLDGPWFFKLTGPEKTVAKWQPSFEQFLDSLEQK